MTETTLASRYFTSYSGVKLPLKLVGELDEADMRNRNTFFRGHFDGRLARAEIDDGSGEPSVVDYTV